MKEKIEKASEKLRVVVARDKAARYTRVISWKTLYDNAIGTIEDVHEILQSIEFPEPTQLSVEARKIIGDPNLIPPQVRVLTDIAFALCGALDAQVARNKNLIGHNKMLIAEVETKQAIRAEESPDQ